MKHDTEKLLAHDALFAAVRGALTEMDAGGWRDHEVRSLVDLIIDRLPRYRYVLAGPWDRTAGDGGPWVDVYCDGELVRAVIAVRAGEDGLIAHYDLEAKGVTPIYREGEVRIEPTKRDN